MLLIKFANELKFNITDEDLNNVKRNYSIEMLYKCYNPKIFDNMDKQKLENASYCDVYGYVFLIFLNMRPIAVGYYDDYHANKEHSSKGYILSDRYTEYNKYASQFGPPYPSSPANDKYIDRDGFYFFQIKNQLVNFLI